MSHFRVLLVLVLVTAPQRKEDPGEYYRRWLEQDVLYIITDEERAVFTKLNTDEERDNFIEQFWVRRDPDPRTPENEFKEEHYRRIQYANETYAAGIPGWKTDRGRVYIVFGKPDQITSYPAGGSYQRKPEEGGGWTSVYPFEVWRYRHIEAVGDDIELEFVNDAGGNLYRLTMDSQQKDEFLHVPGMGFTDAEMDAGGQKSFDRVHGIRENGLAVNQGIYFERAKDSPSEKAQLLMNMSKAPPIRFTDLKEKVSAKITYNTLPFKVSYDFVQVDEQNFMVPVTLSLNPEALTFQDQAGLRHSQLQVYGLVTTLTNQRVFEFDDEIALDYADDKTMVEHVYQRKLPLKPGRFKLDLLVKDAVSGNMGTLAIGVEIPAGSQDRLATSSIVLAKDIEPTTQDLSEPYVLGTYKIRPQVDRIFSPGDDLGFYFEAYNFQIDQATAKPALEIKYGFADPGRLPEAYRPITRGVTLAGDRIFVGRVVRLNNVAKGKHDLVLSVKDTLNGQTATARTPLEIR